MVTFLRRTHPLQVQGINPYYSVSTSFSGQLLIHGYACSPIHWNWPWRTKWDSARWLFESQDPFLRVLDWGVQRTQALGAFGYFPELIILSSSPNFISQISRINWTIIKWSAALRDCEVAFYLGLMAHAIHVSMKMAVWQPPGNLIRAHAYKYPFPHLFYSFSPSSSIILLWSHLGPFFVVFHDH